ncbi:hypothetical protein G9464_19430 [Halostella sp. JP-L12]|uniref:hypothetical protein n=1 Tax=Halostella TaxID=1843185 RepID=UPI000EF7B0FD|nr:MULTISPECIES: hypothetical protein [Halostella]NHN49745.1 hypothetical protein [Halostella sp. JP-L12]
MTTSHGGTSDEGEGYTTLSADYVFRDTGTKSAAGAATLDEGIQDTTAENLFRELKAESGTETPTDEFEGASAESIVADADGHSHEQFTDGGQTLGAGSEVENLLIPDRSEGEEFRWIDPDSTDGGDDAPADQETTDADAAEAMDLFDPSDEDGPTGGSDGGPDVIGGAVDEAGATTDAGSMADDGTKDESPTDEKRGLLARILAILGLK